MPSSAGCRWLGQNLIEGTHSFRFLQKEAHGLFEIFHGGVPRTATGGHIEFYCVSNECWSFLEYSGCELKRQHSHGSELVLEG